MLVSFGPLRKAQAQEIRLSEIPIVNLVERIDFSAGPVDSSSAATTVEFTIVNDTQDDVFWLMRTEVLHPLAFEFFLDTKDAPFFRSPFTAREQKSHASQGPVLTSALLATSPGEQLRLRAVFEAHPTAEFFPISVLSKDLFDAQDQRRRLAHGLFFGAMMTFVALFFLSPNFLLNAAPNWFGVYLASLALLNMHSQGYSLEVLHITPDVYFLATRVLHTCVMLFYLLFILYFLRAATAYPVFWRSVWAFIIIGTTIAVLEQLLASAKFQAIANLVPLTFILLGFWGAYLAVRDRLHGARFFMCGFGLLAVGGVINFMASLPRFALWNEEIDQLTLGIQTADALVFAGAILNQVYGLRRARDQAVTAQLAETDRRLELSNQLLSKEGDLRRAHDLAERHRSNLASTSHDLRQPIASLRASLDIAKERSPELVSELSAGIEFLDSLLGQTLTKTRLTSHIQETPEHGDDTDLQVIFRNAQRMFAMEADKKGIALKIVDSSLVVCMPAIDLIRIVSNLTSNAVNYTSTGAVLIGARRRAGHAAIEIWDTGSGILPDQLDKVLEPYVRGPSTDAASGEGLGLSIVKELADRNGLTLKVRSAYGKGSVFIIEGLVIA